MFNDFLGRRRRRCRAQYARLAAASRQIGYYQSLGVPDTVTGRLELLMLHVALWSRRLAGLGEEGRRSAEALTAAFFDDMEVHLREHGIGDPSVPRKLAELAENFYGRLGAYAAAISGGSADDLESALQRNIYNGNGDASVLAAVVGDLAGRINGADLTALLSGDVDIALPVVAISEG